MKKKSKKEFVIACDMDDVLLVPHSYVAFSQYLGVFDEFGAALKKYKEKKLTYRKLFKKWNALVEEFAPEEKQRAVDCVVRAIPEETIRFVQRAKRIGQFLIISGNDANLVEAVCHRLKVPFLAANKFIFELRVVSQKKSAVLKRSGIKPDVAISDDPWNEADFFRMTDYDIIMKRKRFPVNFPMRKGQRYVIVETLDEVYANLLQIKRELSSR